MATLTIRNLDESVRDALRKRARANGRSTEAEVRHLLEQALTHEAASSNRQMPARSFADIKPVVVDDEMSALEYLDYLRGDR